jgi:hypothetical protein
VNYYQPYWDDYRLVNDYSARVSWFISQGKPAADTLLLHPVETAFSRYDSTEGKRNPFNDRDRSFNELLQRLLAIHIPFELGDEETIAQCGSVKDRCFIIGEMAYRTVILPDIEVLRESTLVLLEQFASAGGKVILMGESPSFLDGKPADLRRLMELPGLIRLDTDTALAQYLLKPADGPFEFSCSGDGSSVFLNVRKTSTGWHIFAFNMDREKCRDGGIAVPGDFGAAIFVGETGEERPYPAEGVNGKTLVRFKLEPGASVMIGLKKEKAPLPAVTSGPCRIISAAGEFNLKRKNPNALVLDTARFRKADGPWSPPYPILAIQHLLLDENYEGEVSLAFSIRCECEFDGPGLALEEPGQIQGEFNGVKINMEPTNYYWCKCFEIVSLPAPLRQGDNILVLTRNFVSPAKPKTNYSALYQNLGGVELESVYLLGDFTVYGVPEKTSTGCVRLSPLFTLEKEKKSGGAELVSGGYPFYAGTMELSRNLNLTEAPRGHAEIYLEGFHGCTASVNINGKTAGLIAWPPYKADVTGLFRQGENRVIIEITNTLRNLLGPYHRPEGEPGHCWGNYSSPDGPWMGDFEFDPSDGGKARWYEHRSPDSSRWTDSYLQIPFGLTGFRIEYKE